MLLEPSSPLPSELIGFLNLAAVAWAAHTLTRYGFERINRPISRQSRLQRSKEDHQCSTLPAMAKGARKIPSSK